MRRMLSLHARVMIVMAILWTLRLGLPAQAEQAVLVLAQANTFQMTEQQFDSWVFQDVGSRDEALKRVDAALQTQFKLLEQTGDFTAAQRAKLELAGQCDIQRFLDEVAAQRRKTKMGMIPQEQLNEVWQLIQPLNQKYTRGLNGRGSTFQKTIRTTLTPEQFARYQVLEQERQQRRYAAVVRTSIATLEASLPLTMEQRERFFNIVITETKPPVGVGQPYYQTMMVMFQISKIPEDKLRPVFNEVEWKVLGEVMRQCKQYEQMFIQQGMLEAGEE